MLAIVLLLIPSNIYGTFVQNANCMPNGNCCCVDAPSDDAPANDSSTISKNCCCSAKRTPAPADEHHPARIAADTSIDNVGPLACLTIVAVEFNDSTISENIWRHIAPRAPPTAVYFACQSILC
ncbi:MAG: hypothetical protein ACI84O_000567 [Myxococcota bacterium]|jgi:hypothetical protein